MNRCRPRIQRTGRIWTLVSVLLICACGDTSGDESSGPHWDRFGAIPLQNLSEYGFFKAPMNQLMPNGGVVPYQVASPLWADHAGKARFIVLPPGELIDAQNDDWVFPEGTILIKNFFYSRDRRAPEETATLIETRLMVKEASDWTGHTYIWNEGLTEATRKVTGKRVNLRFLDEAGEETEQEYIVPNTNQCKDCHEINEQSMPLGLVTRQTRRTVQRDGASVEQQTWLREQGLFSNPPDANVQALEDPYGDGPLDARARSYLDSNCAHCHREGGNGGPSGLVLLARERVPATYGVCKAPVAAGEGAGGRTHSITPGHPERSIIVYRMESTNPEVKMPEIPNRLPDSAGVELISEWIRSMDAVPCD